MDAKTKKLLFWGLGTLSALAVADAFIFERYAIRLRRFHYGPPKSRKVLRLLQVSDLHLEGYPFKIKDILRSVHSARPDLIFFTGDFVDKNGKLDLVRELIEGISRNIPKVAIMGNWEHGLRINEIELRQLLRPYNCKLLLNDSITLHLKGIPLTVTGLDDSTYGHPDMEMAIASNKHISPHHIVLIHNPGYFPEVERYLEGHENLHVDFILAGHTHGGQITLPGLVLTNSVGSGPYVDGWYRGQQTEMYVSKGIGTSRIPARLLARAEMPLFEYHV